MVSVESLSKFGAVLADNGYSPLTEKTILSKQTAKAMLPLMLICGLSVNSGKFVRKYGLPSKQSDSGGKFLRLGLLIIIP